MFQLAFARPAGWTAERLNREVSEKFRAYIPQGSRNIDGFLLKHSIIPLPIPARLDVLNRNKSVEYKVTFHLEFKKRHQKDCFLLIYLHSPFLKSKTQWKEEENSVDLELTENAEELKKQIMEDLTELFGSERMEKYLTEWEIVKPGGDVVSEETPLYEMEDPFQLPGKRHNWPSFQRCLVRVPEPKAIEFLRGREIMAIFEFRTEDEASVFFYLSRIKPLFDQWTAAPIRLHFNRIEFSPILDASIAKIIEYATNYFGKKAVAQMVKEDLHASRILSTNLL
ncbi:MAG TPA: hypothetical protein VLE89_01470 [Chlamydiales bacterium]|nr:hypothetical protein [Chlamydiales bacterium]